MAFRALTDVYILMRNNAVANKNVFHDNAQYRDDNNDRTALVIDLESGDARVSSNNNNSSNSISSKIPPSWTLDVEDIQFESSQVKKQLKELGSLHDKHLNRPTLDDNTDEEQRIDLLTKEITQALSECQMKTRRLSISIQKLRSLSDKRLLKNIVSNLASSLQELTISFRKSQSLYLKKIQSRKERSNMLFDTSEYQPSTALMTEEDEEDQNFMNYNQQQEQLQLERVSERMVSERETEIGHIVTSIQDLNELFKDLAVMVVDQGTILDRIDCNIEKTAYTVDQGLQQLQKASKHQKKASRKMYLIAILMCVLMFLMLVLVVTKF